MTPIYNKDMSYTEEIDIEKLFGEELSTKMAKFLHDADILATEAKNFRQNEILYDNTGRFLKIILKFQKLEKEKNDIVDGLIKKVADDLAD